ncbi:MAG TPA: glycosyltransferase family 39 protein [Polyangia bacterium]|jgi:dolichyl-phosphate-mannose--protein O-mannosyl transferase|nr:glycosyltransferase family 39 protein [Polyangia bacterium]
MTERTGPGWRTALASPVTPLGLLVLVLVVAGAAIRIHHFATPSTYLFDEHHFVDNARRYVSGQSDLNDHPPLGKLFIAVSILALGDGPIAWRMPAQVAGALTLLLGSLAASRLFRDARAGWLAAALIAGDGFLASYSRVALLDGQLAACAAGALLLATARAGAATAVGAGMLTGAAANIKFSGGAVAVPLLLALAMARQPARRRLALAALLLAVAAAFYVILFSIGLRIAGHHGAGPAAVVAETLRLLRAHSGATDMKNSWVSGWPTWVLPARVLPLASLDGGLQVRLVSSLGNLAVWWPAMAVALSATVAVIWRGLGATLALEPTTASAPEAALGTLPLGWRGLGLVGFVAANGPSVVLVLSAAIAFLAPWVMTHRDSYIYHFLPAYVADVVLLAGFAAFVGRRWPLVTVAFVAVVSIVAAFYAPVWSLLPISERAASHRLFLPGWRG